MNEEEIIKTLNYQLKMKDTDVYTPINYDAIQGLLDLYTKQQKEIKRLKKFEKYYENEKVVWQRKDYISKDKIKEKIEEITKEYYKLFEEKRSLDFMNINSHRYNAMKLVLEELLGETND